VGESHNPALESLCIETDILILLVTEIDNVLFRVHWAYIPRLKLNSAVIYWVIYLREINSEAKISISPKTFFKMKVIVKLIRKRIHFQ
jgi:hypothetical protein